MADRPTKKERREAARSARHEAQARAAKTRMRKRLTSSLVVVAVIALIVGIVQFQGASGKKAAAGLNTLATDIGCTELKSFASMGATHIGAEESATYDRLPPDSGNHFGGGTSNTGVLTTAPRNELLAHNMEHGQIGLMYAEGLDPALVASLDAVASGTNLWVLSSPYAQMPAGTDVAMISWRHRIECTGLDAADAADLGTLADEFTKQRRGNGPESVPGQPAEGS